MKMAEATLNPARMLTIPVYKPPKPGMSQGGGLGAARGVQPIASTIAAPTINRISVPTIHMAPLLPYNDESSHGVCCRSPRLDRDHKDGLSRIVNETRHPLEPNHARDRLVLSSR